MNQCRNVAGFIGHFISTSMWEGKHTWLLFGRRHLTQPFVCNYLWTPLDKIVAISQTTLSNAFSWMKSFVFRLKFHWGLFLRVLDCSNSGALTRALIVLIFLIAMKWISVNSSFPTICSIFQENSDLIDLIWWDLHHVNIHLLTLEETDCCYDNICRWTGRMILLVSFYVFSCVFLLHKWNLSRIMVFHSHKLNHSSFAPFWCRFLAGDREIIDNNYFNYATKK